MQQEQATAELGANGWTTFWRITLPALRWGFIYGVTLTLAHALGEFGAVLVVGGGTQGRTETATLYVSRVGSAPVRARVQRWPGPGCILHALGAGDGVSAAARKRRRRVTA